SISKELAHKIWRVTPNDLAQGIPALTNSAYPCIGGVDWGSGGSSSRHSANDSANAFISEVERSLYGNSTGHPRNGSKNYFKAAENYAIYGDNFLDFPKDTSTCFLGLGSTGGSASNPPPGFERSARLSALYERKQTPSQGGLPTTLNFSGHHHPQHPQQSSQQQQRQSATDCNRNNHSTQSRNCGQSGSGNDFPIPQIYHQLFSSSPQTSRSNAKPQTHSRTLQPFGPSQSSSQHYQQQRGAGTASGHQSDHHSGHPSANEISLSQLYQQLMARNLRPGHLHQHQQQQTNSNAAAAAMIYANLELQQQMQLRQLQIQHQHQQQQLHQQQQARLPRGIYGGNNGQGSGGAAPPTAGKEPPVGNHK
ncbi:hypothetical protein KR074_011339, partial [Drosophila pseudoananassae]